MTLAQMAFAEVILCWFAFLAGGLVNFILVRRRRGEESASERQQSLRAPSSMWGIALEGIAIGVAFGFDRPLDEAALGSVVAAMALAPASLVLAALASRELGTQLRIKAVVTQDHKLVTTGPYRLVRHPIYLALFGLMLATALVNARWPATLCAVVLYVAGTEIRVHAEDGLLARRFGAEFEAYRRRVRAYLPLVR